MEKEKGSGSGGGEAKDRRKRVREGGSTLFFVRWGFHVYH